jgi:hypothetical protein
MFLCMCGLDKLFEYKFRNENVMKIQKKMINVNFHIIIFFTWAFINVNFFD